MKTLRDIDFVALVVAVETFFYGLYLLCADTYFVQRFDIHSFTPMLENSLGVVCTLIGLTKIVGLRKHILVMKRVGIVGMCFIWGMVVGLYLFEALNGNFLGLIWSVPTLTLCLRVARRGDYVE